MECAVGTAADLRATETVPSTTPEETIGRVVAFFEREGPVEAIGIGLSGPSTGSLRRRPGVTSRRRQSRAGPTRTSARRSAGGFRYRWPSIQTSMPPRSVNTAGAQRRGSTAFVTSPSAPGLVGAAWSAENSCTDSCIPNSAICASHTTATRIRFRVSARTTATAGKGSRRGVRSKRWGRPAAELADEAVWALEARYLALGLVCVICVLSPSGS